MWRKKISVVLIFVGVLIAGYNLYWLSKGYSASTKPEIRPSDFKESIETIKTEAKIKPVLGEKIGVLTIPKLNRSLPIFEGTNSDILKQGVGHFTHSVLPGENNNCVLSGHRDTVFRGLGEVGINDELIVTTDDGEYLYKIRKVRIVDQRDRTVLVPKPKSTLTVTTCYPFSFIGNAPKRYILVADLIAAQQIEKHQAQ
ncbi:class D sortase [Neobacillus sp. CF12]|uniref:class D sortase n=1 Tax=Neobacillus sp. CF12 TaxID=3055864 RepID=UPI0025A08E85|nr:class D sortase [Neobacillus sp. CF12]MDM5329692.1 class D sortase [Neobacillus sp. CF12]